MSPDKLAALEEEAERLLLTAREDAARAKIQLAQHLHAEAKAIDTTTQSTTGQCGMNNQQGESARAMGGAGAQTWTREPRTVGADAGSAQAEALQKEYDAELDALKRKHQQRLAQVSQVTIDTPGTYTGAGGRGGGAGASGQRAWGAASGGGAGVAQGVCVSGPPQGEAGGVGVGSAHTPLGTSSLPPDMSLSNTVFDPTLPFMSQHREDGPSEDSTMRAMGQYMEETMGKKLLGRGTRTLDASGSTIWHQALSAPLLASLRQGAGFYISWDHKELSKTSNTAVKAMCALVKAFGETQGSGEATWFKRRLDERADKIAKAYTDAAVKSEKAGHHYEADVMGGLAEWWDRLGRTVVTLMATTKMEDTGKAIVAQQLEIMNQCLRDPNRLTTMLTKMRTKAAMAHDGVYHFTLDAAPGGPTAAALAKQMEALELQLTKQASASRADVSKVTAATAQAKNSVTGEVTKQTAKIDKMQKRIDELLAEKNRSATSLRAVEKSIKALEAAAKQP